MAPAISTRGLRKAFGKNAAVDGVDLEVPKGGIFGLVGPDGAGKTTLIRLLVTAMLPSGGSASVFGHDVVKAPDEVKKHIGYLSQQFSLYRDLSVIENIAFFRDIHKVHPKDAADRIDRLLDFSRLAPFTGRPAGKLSGGMKQKLGLCCALVHTPEILFLDEPTTGVDPISRRELWGLLYELWREGMTIIISTPYMDEAERCTELAFMHSGKLLTTGTPTSLIDDFPWQIARITTSQARLLAKELRKMDGVQEVSQHGDVVHVMTENYAGIESALRSKLSELGVDADLRQVKPNLEDVFLHFEGGAE